MYDDANGCGVLHRLFLAGGWEKARAGQEKTKGLWEEKRLKLIVIFSTPNNIIRI